MTQLRKACRRGYCSSAQTVCRRQSMVMSHLLKLLRHHTESNLMDTPQPLC